MLLYKLISIQHHTHTHTDHQFRRGRNRAGRRWNITRRTRSQCSFKRNQVTSARCTFCHQSNVTTEYHEKYGHKLIESFSVAFYCNSVKFRGNDLQVFRKLRHIISSSCVNLQSIHLHLWSGYKNIEIQIMILSVISPMSLQSTVRSTATWQSVTSILDHYQSVLSAKKMAP